MREWIIYGVQLEVELIDGRDGVGRCKGGACLVRFEVLRSNAAFSKMSATRQASAIAQLWL